MSYVWTIKYNVSGSAQEQGPYDSFEKADDALTKLQWNEFKAIVEASGSVITDIRIERSGSAS